MEIGEWRRGRIIGRGASATVSLATSMASGQVFAVKSSELCSLRGEQRLLSALDSPFVVSYLGFDVAPAHAPGAGFHYNLFMEYAPGGSLSDEIKRQSGRLDELAIRSYLHDILSGLVYLHSNGVVHCDLKSQNVLICSDGRAKIADFGCARKVDGDEERHQPRGTPMFMAPEVARGEEQSAPADVWSLGCTTIEMATGRPPWPHMADPVSALHLIAFSADVPEFPSWISAEGKDFLSRCLRRDPRERWTAEQLLRHPFVAACFACPRPDSGTNYDRVSPRSTLDQAFWESLADEGDEAVGEPSEDPSERMQCLIGGGAPSWTWNDGWVTVRSHAGEDSLPATGSITEDHRSVNRGDSGGTSSSDFIYSTDRIDIEHVMADVDDTSIARVEEGIGNQVFTCKREVNLVNGNCHLVIDKDRIDIPNCPFCSAHFIFGFL
ncbi:unnamed protein product [Musa acuminata subsp. burmannicoides]